MPSRLRSTSSGRLLDLLVLLGVFLALAAWLGWRGLAAQRHLEDARDSIAVARTALLDRDVQEAERAITAAGRDTERARALTSDPVWRLAAAVPGVGASLDTAAGLARAADDLARRVLPPALEGARDIDPDALRRTDGSVDLGVLKAATPAIAISAERAATVSEQVAALPTAGVVEPVIRAHARLAEQAAQLAGVLDGSAQALQLAPTLLGEQQSRRYLMLVQQTAESRGTGGLIGGYVALEAEAGRLTVVEEGSNADLFRTNNQAVPVPEGVSQDYVDLYGADGALEDWRNINLSPDLPVVQRVINAKWRARGGQDLDGVVVLDALALASILRGSGPIALGDGRSIPPGELVDYLAIGQYRDFAPDSPEDQRQSSRERKDQLDVVAAVAAQRLAGGGGDTLSLLRGVGEAVRSGHLRMSSDEPELQQVLARTGVDGALPPTDVPVAYPVVYNSTGGKLDHFLDRRVAYTAGPCTGDRRRSRITVELTNRAPAAGLPPYVTIRETVEGRIASTDNAVTLNVYGTAGARLVRATLDGEPLAPEDPDGLVLYNASEAGLPMWNTFLDLPRGQTRTLVMELDEPVVAGEPRVPEQPLSRPLERVVDVPVCG